MPVPAPVRSAPAAPPKPPTVAPQKPLAQPQTALPALEPPWHVILLDDTHHTFEYVIEMLQQIFGHPPKLGWRMAVEVDEKGRVIVATVHKELAELRKQQIEEYGPDPRVKDPAGQRSMCALIEPSLD